MAGRFSSPDYDAESARMQNLVGTRLAELRRSRGMTQGQLAAALAPFGVRVQTAAVSKWEKGDSVPNAYQLFALCHALDFSAWADAFGDVSFLPDTALNPEGQALLAEFRSWLESRRRYRVSPARPAPLVEMNVSLIPASAGFGEALDNNQFERMSFPSASVPDGADFAVRVNGDSMEPVLADGQYAWIRQCAVLHPGEVGLFVVDGEGYIKVYSEQEPAPADRDSFTDSTGVLRMQPVLVSCNAQYAPKIISPESDFRIVGRVLNG